MKKLCCIIVCIILACAVFSSCSDKETPPVVDPVVPSNTIERTEPSVPPQKENDYEEGTYTLMIYMCGSDLETRTGEATKSITDMLSVELPSDKRHYPGRRCSSANTIFPLSTAVARTKRTARSFLSSKTPT